MSIIIVYLACVSVAATPLSEGNKTSVQAMKSYEQAYDALMENIVNVKTPAYKSIDTMFEQAENGGIQAEQSTQYTRGSLEETNRPLDVAIDGNGFLVVELTKGIKVTQQNRLQMVAGTGYTRDGRFQINENNELVTLVGGYRVLGKGGAIVLAPYSGQGDNIVYITPQGAVLQNNNVIGELQVVTIDKMKQLERLNGSFFRVPLGRTDFVITDVPEVKLRSGYVEASNVDLSRQLVELPLNQRKYDANSKALQLLRRTESTAREMGRVQ